MVNPHRISRVYQHPRDRVDNPSLPWVCGVEPCPGRHGSASSAILGGLEASVAV